MLQQPRAIEPFGLQPAADQPGPLVAADVGEGGRLHAQPGHGHARVVHDPARHHLERLGGQQSAAADGYIQANRPAKDVGHARSTENAVDVFSHSGTVYLTKDGRVKFSPEEFIPQTRRASDDASAYR